MLTRRSFLAAAGATALSAAVWSKAARVKLGVCTADIDAAVKYGFDYIEPSAADIVAMSEERFRQYTEQVLSSPIRCEAFNSFIRRPELKVVGNEVPSAALSEYVDQCLGRCRKLGASIVVWGSAGSRQVPEGFSREGAREQIAEFLRMAAPIAQRHDIVLAIEPLRHQESNILNTGAESLEMVRRVNHPNLRLMIDYYHMREENETSRILETAREEIVHLHFANPHGRAWPHEFNEDQAEYEAFFGYLKKTGYSGRISIEGRGSFEADGALGRSFLKRATEN
jgi:sugar phosphate isomerase/epimerase